MGAAIGFAAVIIVFGIFIPNVLHALEEFLLQFFHMATNVLQMIESQNARVR